MGERYRRILGWALIGLVALILFPVPNVDFGVDSVSYFKRSVDLVTSFKYTNAYRGPVFPALAAVVMFFAGVTSQAVLMLPRIAYAVAVIGMAGLTWRMYGFIPSLFATLYFAFSPLIHEPGCRFHIDIFVVAFSIWALWVFYVALSRQSVRLAIASGILLGVAFLTKEIAILLLPLWGFVWLGFQEDRRRAFRLSAYSLCAAVLVVMPWSLLVAFIADPSFLLGKASSSGRPVSILLHSMMGDPVRFLLQVPGNIFSFLDIYFIEFKRGEGGIYGYLAEISFLFVAVRWLKSRQRQDLFALLLVFSFIPLMILLEKTQMHSRQAAIVFTMFSVSVAGAGKSVRDGVAWVSDRILKKRLLKYRPVWDGGLTTFIMIGALGVLIFNTPSAREQFTSNFMSYALLSGEKTWFRPSGLYNPQLVEAGEWAREHLDQGKRIMAAYSRNAMVLNQLWGTKEVVSMVCGSYNLKIWRQEYLEGRAGGAEAPVFYLWGVNESIGGGEKRYNQKFLQRYIREDTRDSDASFLPNDYRNLIFLGAGKPEKFLLQCLDVEPLWKVPDVYCKLFFIHESAILSQIDRQSVQFVLVSDRMGFLSRYFDANPMFEQVYTTADSRLSAGRVYGLPDAGESILIYKVHDRLTLDSYVPTVAEQVLKMMKRYVEKHPKEYAVWRKQVLMEGLGLSEEMVCRIEQAKVECVRKASYSDRSRPCEE